jgi:hypothetical protein
MYYDEDDESQLMEPPRYDMLTVKFRGDNHEMTLPYCEVANGDITRIAPDVVGIKMLKENRIEETELTFKELFEVIEKTLDTKEIVELWLQKAETYEKILVS